MRKSGETIGYQATCSCGWQGDEHTSSSIPGLPDTNVHLSLANYQKHISSLEVQGWVLDQFNPYPNGTERVWIECKKAESGEIKVIRHHQMIPKHITRNE